MSIDYKHTIHLPETRFAMKGDLPTREPLALAAWAESDLHARIQAQTASRPSYVLHDGPPYANGQIHIGHAVNKTLKDIVVNPRASGRLADPSSSAGGRSTCPSAAANDSQGLALNPSWAARPN